MPLFHTRGLDRIETASHCRRVCALALRPSAFLRLSKEVQGALSIAASLHHICGPDFHEGSISEIFEDLPWLAEAKPASNDVLRLAEKVLIRLRDSNTFENDAIDIPAEVVRACDQLDEA